MKTRIFLSRDTSKANQDKIDAWLMERIEPNNRVAQPTIDWVMFTSTTFRDREFFPVLVLNFFVIDAEYLTLFLMKFSDFFEVPNDYPWVIE